MMDLLTSAMDAGAALAETFSKPVNTGASFTRYGTVVKNNGTTLDVELCGATLAAVPMLTTCAGAKAGDRCLLTVDGPLVTVTGILANADNTHYVKTLWQGSISLSGTASIPGIQSDRLIYIKLTSTGTLAPIVTSDKSQRFGVAEPQGLNYRFNGGYVRLDGESLIFSEVMYSTWRYNALGQGPTCVAGDATSVTAIYG